MQLHWSIIYATNGLLSYLCYKPLRISLMERPCLRHQVWHIFLYLIIKHTGYIIRILSLDESSQTKHGQLYPQRRCRALHLQGCEKCSELYGHKLLFLLFYQYLGNSDTCRHEISQVALCSYSFYKSPSGCGR